MKAAFEMLLLPVLLVYFFGAAEEFATTRRDFSA
jgi:hypothetical protein